MSTPPHPTHLRNTGRPYWRAGWFRVTAFWLSALTVGVLSITPVENLPPQALDVWDKAQHAAGFLVLSLLGFLAHPRHLARVTVGLLIYGMCIEVAQSATGWRHGDLADWLADACGVCAGLVALRLWKLWADNAK
jgi:VanZ family protein